MQQSLFNDEPKPEKPFRKKKHPFSITSRKRAEALAKLRREHPELSSREALRNDHYLRYAL